MKTSTDKLAGFGIGVSDLKESASFYEEAFGMYQARTYDLPEMNEIVMSLPESKGSSIVLMCYKDGKVKDFKNYRIKLVFYVANAGEIVERIRKRGLEIIREPALYKDTGATLAFAKDPDGYVIELLQLPERSSD